MAVKENELYFVVDSFSGIFRFDITNFKNVDSDIYKNIDNDKNECVAECDYIGEVADNSEHRWQQPYGYICTQSDDIYISSVYSNYITKCNNGNIKHSYVMKNMMREHWDK